MGAAMKCQVCGHENVDEAKFCASCGAAIPTKSSSQDNPLIGQIIGNRYRITGVIGEGGMGVVYVGEQQMGSTIRKVAVKTLHPHLSKDESVLKRFHRECGTVAQLEHPNTIKVYDFGSTPDGTLYIAMEFVAGRSLSDVLEKEHGLPAERVVQILKQVCGALDEAHQLGIVHRDLKPDNIILTQRAGEQDFVKVLDFGIAARTESADAAREQKLTQQGTVLGTPPYMSPEQFTGKALDRRSDIYSLGVMAYEMLTGRLPFEAETPWQWATQHMTAQPVPFETVAPQLRASEPMRRAVMRALAKDREQRQTTAGQFINELSQGLEVGNRASQTDTASNGTYQATAAMPEMPDFSGAGTAPIKTAAIAASPATNSATTGTPAVAPVIAAPKRNKGKSGLIIGVAGLVGVVAIGVIFMVRSNKPSDDPQSASSGVVAASAPVATSLAPEISPSVANNIEPETITPPTTPAKPAADPGARKPAKPASSTATSTGTGTQTTVNPPAGGGGTPTPTPVQPPQQNQGCGACMAAATSGDFGSLSHQVSACADAGEKQKCINAAKNSAIRQAAAARASHDCAKVKTIANAMNAISPMPALQSMAQTCQ